MNINNPKLMHIMDKYQASMRDYKQGDTIPMKTWLKDVGHLLYIIHDEDSKHGNEKDI